MSTVGPIIYIDDDEDDHEILLKVLSDLQVPNPVVGFTTCIEAYDYLKTTSDQPFLIICDVNLPVQSGIELKMQIDGDEDLRKKSIPFVFYSTSVDQRFVNLAYTQMTVQGYFRKENNFQDVKQVIRLLVDYWNHCRHPNAT